MEDKTKLSDVIKIDYLDPSTAVFSERGGMISLKIKDGGSDREYDRVFLHRSFPYELADGYISVLDRDGNEIGMIRSVSDFDERAREMIERELKRRYRVRIIKRIRSVNERYGYSYWKIEDDGGEREFTVQDTYKSITKITEDRICITDVDGNRYEIPSLSALDKKSYKRRELFL